MWAKVFTRKYSNTDSCLSCTPNKINIQYTRNILHISLSLSLFYLSILVWCRRNECCCLLEHVDLNKMPAQNIQLWQSKCHWVLFTNNCTQVFSLMWAEMVLMQNPVNRCLYTLFDLSFVLMLMNLDYNWWGSSCPQ